MDDCALTRTLLVTMCECNVYCVDSQLQEADVISDASQSEDVKARMLKNLYLNSLVIGKCKVR